MACTTHQDRILEYLENQLPLAEREAVETHLSQCGECRDFAGQMRRLDQALAGQLASPALSAEFDTRLWRRIETEAALLPVTDRLARKRTMEAEFQAGLEKLLQRSLGFPAMLDILTIAVAAAAGGWLLQFGMPYAVQHFAQAGNLAGNQALLASSTAGFLFAAVGYAFAFRRRLGRLLSHQ